MSAPGVGRWSVDPRCFEVLRSDSSCCTYSPVSVRLMSGWKSKHEETLRSTSKPNESLLHQEMSAPGVGRWSVDARCFEVLRSDSSCCTYSPASVRLMSGWKSKHEETLRSTSKPNETGWVLEQAESRSMKKHFEALRSQTNPFYIRICRVGSGKCLQRSILSGKYIFVPKKYPFDH